MRRKYTEEREGSAHLLASFLFTRSPRLKSRNQIINSPQPSALSSSTFSIHTLIIVPSSTFIRSSIPFPSSASSKLKFGFYNLAMVGEKQTSILLELSATDNLDGFKRAVEIQGFDVNEASLWYGRRIGSRKMLGLEERTPLLIASLYGSFRILNYILRTLKVDPNRACGSDGATALHFAAASGIDSSAEVVQLLIEAMADVNALDANGNRPCDLIPPRLKTSNHLKRKKLEILLRGYNDNINNNNSVIEEAYEEEKEKEVETEKEKPQSVKEFAIDVPLPDINIGIYSTDEFRMYSFKVKPCSRAYSHDWTECPFVHPGENARRRDPRKYQYTCVPCPEFRKGNCPKSDNCEYAHGVFESWLHPAQYRTRLCKDETGCLRKVCFFAHKHEELRPLYASTGSALPSPKSLSSGPIDMTPPMSPLGSSSSCSSPIPMWANKPSVTPPPTLQLPGSRLKTALHARDLEMELELELLGLESLRNQNQRQQQQLIDEISGLSSPYGVKPTNLEGVFGLSSSPRLTTATTATTQLQMNALRSSYPAANLSSSPVRMSSSPYGFDSSGGVGGSVAAAMMNSRSASFAKRSQSFIDRGASVNSRAASLGFTAAANSAGLFPSKQHTEWGSPDGKLEWGFTNKGEDLNKLKKSASFGYRGGNGNVNVNGTNRTTMAPSTVNEPDVSWVHSLVKDVPAVEPAGLYNSKLELNSPWVDQLYIEQEQVSA